MRFFIGSLIGSLLSIKVAATIMQLASVLDLRRVFRDVKQKNLVLLDVDNVLLAPCDRVLRYAGERNNYRAQRLQTLVNTFQDQNVSAQGVVCSKVEYLLSTIVASGEVAPVLKDMPNWVQDVVSQPNNTVLALSTSVQRSWGRIYDGAALVHARLTKFGYVLSSVNQSFLFFEPVPELEEGILYTRSQGKVRTVVALLDKLTEIYQHLWVVDDRVSVLRGLDKALEGYPIPFTGVHFTALRDQQEYLDENIADQQFQTLVDRSIWISDAEAYAELTLWPSNTTEIPWSPRSLRGHS